MKSVPPSRGNGVSNRDNEQGKGSGIPDAVLGQR